MACGCNQSAPKPPDQQFEVRLPDGSKKIVNSEHDAKIQVTMAGGGTYSRI